MLLAERLDQSFAQCLANRGKCFSLLQEDVRVEFGGQPLALTSLEYELLAVLIAHPGRVYAREELLRRLAGFVRGEPFDRAIDIHVSNLRRKLRAALGEDAPIETVRGVGYRLREASPAVAESSDATSSTTARLDLGQLALAALGRAPTPLLVLSPDRTVLLYNDAAEHLCGWKAEDVAGQVKCYSLLGCHDEDGALLCHGRCVLRQGGLTHMSERQARYVITLKDGRELPVEAHYSRLGDTSAAGDYTLLVRQPQG
ncbi:MAG TPA: winged helix-turn-helix domain-containing protein [Ktedonobacterales bacterium]